MASAADYRRLGAGLLAVSATALLVWFGTGLHPWWPLLWFAPLPVLVYAGRASWWAAALVAVPGWMLGNLNLWHYFGRVGVTPLGKASIVLTVSLAFALAVLHYRGLLRRGAYWSALLAFPAQWTAFEYLVNLTSLHGTAGNLAYSQLGFLPFLQLASLTGPWGMSFLLLLFSSALATGLYLRASAPRQALRIVGASLGVIAAVLVFGAVRLALPEAGPQVKVGVIAADPPLSPEVADAGAPAQALFQAYADRVTALAAQGAQVIVLPEKLAVAVEPDTGEMDRLFQSLADHSGAQLVVGLVRVAAPLKYNEARVYRPAQPLQLYEKHHMLPAFESIYTVGTSRTLLPQPSGTWGVAICKDMDFTPLSRQYGQDGAGLMLVPAWDFVMDRVLHGHMALMRGVESGFAMVRAAKQGYLTVSDDRGRIIAETSSDAAPFATLLATVPAAHETTLYLLLGDWFAWLLLALLAFTLLPYVLPRGRASASS